MKKTIFLMLVCCMLSSSVSAVPELKGTPGELSNYLNEVESNFVRLFATSRVEVKADRAIVKIRVAVEDASLQSALKKNQTIESSITKSLQKSGISPDRIMTSAFSSVPEYGLLGKKAKGYKIKNVIKVKVEGDADILEVAKQVDTYKEVEYVGMDFEHSEKEKLENTAVEKACDRLMAKKSMYEKKFNVKLTLETFEDGASSTAGVSVSNLAEREEGYGRNRIRSAAKSVSYASTGFGQIIISGQISATYTMKPNQK